MTLRDPDELHRPIHVEEARARRGRLTVFLGAAPGAGKTFAMLEAARARHNEGVDVVVAVAETHGRAETARFLDSLEILPRRMVSARGSRTLEFDLDAALARRPGLLVVDELEHTNAPGSRHATRWQDIREVLDAGIAVYTTLNIQHLESLNDVIARITGVRIRETVPDSILEQADRIELVDVEPEVLLQRLEENRVHLPAGTGRAAEHFYRKGNLLALRELARRCAADRTAMRESRAERGSREAWATAERLLVCIGPSPAAGPLVRAGRRMAKAMHADWMVLHVETPAEQRLSPAARENLRVALELADQLGGRAVTLSGRRIADEILAYAAAHGITRILVGKPGRRRRIGLRPPLVDALVRHSGTIEILAVSGQEDDEGSLAPRQRRGTAGGYLAAAAATLVPTAIGLGARALGGELALSQLAMLYLLAVVAVAGRYHRGPTIFASLLGVALFEFCFVSPPYAFSIGDGRSLPTLAVMLAVALAMGALTGRVRSRAELARERERRTAILYATNRDLSAARTHDEVVAAALKHLRDSFGPDCVLLLPDAAGRLRPAVPSPYPLDERELGAARWALDQRRAAGPGTGNFPAAVAFYLPLAAADRLIGVVGIRPRDKDPLQDPSRRRLLETLAGETAIALERVALAERSRRSEIESETQRLREALASLLAQDLRTPLATIEGAAAALVRSGESGDAPSLGELAGSIIHESQGMSRLVANLIDLTRIESGTLEVRREWRPLGALVDAALLRAQDQLAGREVTTDLPPTLPPVPVDQSLMEQVLLNLLENAARHTLPGTPVDLGAEAVSGGVIVSVGDRGPGVPAGQEEQIFEKFQRASTLGGGAGLGLSICRGIVVAHGGRIWVERRPGGGALFRFTIPVLGAPPPGAMEARETRTGETGPTFESDSPWRDTPEASPHQGQAADATAG